ncbi:hypothetical protein [Blastococcus sp. TF02A-26]|uniref:hypothetical protein n=1 Tax=Blastococcus sp. TF02A-26 TaxID=2250577 RepID=UPI000DEA426E|nr:hypothetical protein [Blastococcus sp. TF02A-26]RBY86850.1 hypothetical protein DQ240_08600 [Blastococcus sp. TF02A-26]
MAGTAVAERRSSEWACGEALETAAGYVQSVRTAGTPTARARAAASRDGLSAVRTVLRELPDHPLSFSDAPAGRELRAWFRPDRRLPFNRAPIAVLELPGTSAEYLRGRPRQALRTNAARAAAEGVRCAPVHDPAELRRIAVAIADRRGATPDHVAPEHQDPSADRLWSVAYDADGDPVAVTQTVVDESRAGLITLMTASGHPAARVTRYALQAHLAGRLIDRGVTTLAVGGSMLLTSPGTRYFQRRTGYVPVHVRPDGVPVRRRGRAVS